MKEIKVGGHVFKIEKLSRGQISHMEDESMIAIPGQGAKILWGTWKDMHCVEGIVEWNIKDAKGEIVPINLDNVREYMTDEEVEMVWAEVAELGHAKEAEKKG